MSSGVTFARLWKGLEPIGRTTSGYRRYTWTSVDTLLRNWFIEGATSRGLDVETDRNGNIWAWWDVSGSDEYRRRPAPKAGGDTHAAPRPGAIVTGSHLDSVPDGGAFDGPLGVVSGLAAIDLLRARGVTPRRPIAVTVFVEEEGARFGLACLGSKLLTGAVDPGRAAALADDSGVTWAEAMAAAGLDPAGIGPDEDLLGNIHAFVELHIEQGRALAALPAPATPPATSAPSGSNAQLSPLERVNSGALAVADGIWPHGRWRFDFTGVPDHAGTARFADRRDPMLPFASTVLAARRIAADLGALATFGKVAAEPGAVNGVPAAVHAWLDARAPDEETLAGCVTTVRSEADVFSGEHGVGLSVRQESATAVTVFDPGLRERIAAILGGVPVLPTGAGHDAGVLAARVPTAMLFVRNPTGVSHSPAEHAEAEDCEAGVLALAAVLEELACR